MVIEILMRVVSHGTMFALQRMQTNRKVSRRLPTLEEVSYANTTYWYDGIGWQEACGYCTTYTTRQEAENQLKRLFGGTE